MTHTVIANRVAQSEGHMLLPQDLVKALGTKASIEGPVGGRLGVTEGSHCAQPTGRKLRP
jgi:hypothetical protein